MIDLESRLNLERDEIEARECVEGRGGALLSDSENAGIYWATLQPRTAPAERFFVRIEWQTYPHAPPSVKFADGIRGRLDVTKAWPVVGGYRPGSFDICKPFTAEGFALHPEWRTGPDAWPTQGNPLSWVLHVLQQDLDSNYGGRAT